MSNPTLSIIILSYNTADITVNCLKSILADKGLKQIPYEIIVIDNASSDNSAAKISAMGGSAFGRKKFKLIINKTNLGFAKGNNQGLKIAKGNYVLFLNSDTIILHSAISQSLDWLCSHPEASVCTAQLLNPDKTIQPTGGFFPNIINTLAWIFHLDDLPFFNSLVPPIHPHPPQFYTHNNFYLHDQRLDWITGAFFLARRFVLRQVNGFDENYFLYGEELELCYRIKKAYPSTQIWYLIGPQVIHLGRASSSSQNAISREKEGMASFFRKHRLPWQYSVIKTLLHQ